MNSRIHNAVRDALSLVRQSNVGDATAVIREALSTDKIDLQSKKSTSKPRRISSPGLSISYDSATAPEPTEPRHASRHEEIRKSVLKKVRSNPKSPGSFTSRKYRHVERDLSYMLYVPAQNSAHERSLLLMLHGCTQNPNDFARGTQMNALADEFNFIVAYPLQPPTANASGCWNWFDSRHQKHGSGEPAMLAGLADNLKHEFNVSETRVFVAGLSAGGAMAEVLGTTYPKLFAGVGVHSGLPHGAATSLGNALSAMKGSIKTELDHGDKTQGRSRRIVFHGSSDATVHPSNGAHILEQARRFSRKLKEVTFTEKINGREVTRTILEDDNGCAMVELWVVKGGGHAWFGGNTQGSYTDQKGPDASREMVRFFIQV